MIVRLDTVISNTVYNDDGSETTTISSVRLRVRDDDGNEIGNATFNQRSVSIALQHNIDPLTVDECVSRLTAAAAALLGE